MSEESGEKAKAQVVATEVAVAEFERFCEAMDLDVDIAKMDEDDRKGFDKAKGKFVRAVERGVLTVDDGGQPVLRTSDGKIIVFHEPTGASFMAMDQRKKGHDVAKMYAVMADMTRLDAVNFAKMQGRDLTIAQTIVTLFLG